MPPLPPASYASGLGLLKRHSAKNVQTFPHSHYSPKVLPLTTHQSISILSNSLNRFSRLSVWGLFCLGWGLGQGVCVGGGGGGRSRRVELSDFYTYKHTSTNFPHFYFLPKFGEYLLPSPQSYIRMRYVIGSIVIEHTEKWWVTVRKLNLCEFIFRHEGTVLEGRGQRSSLA